MAADPWLESARKLKEIDGLLKPFLLESKKQGGSTGLVGSLERAQAILYRNACLVQEIERQHDLIAAAPQTPHRNAILANAAELTAELNQGLDEALQAYAKAAATPGGSEASGSRDVD
eukprot:CAMPEP_0205921478 /NCGR_PEP_ID=MMETSP1325-20131115/12875_1 /ASSEMBLY_ACC=CAM_ASM_000708 /TAXON_ID=236786 /ORGANISM="Florenciella sp., Strain RCC1007" /LENGTH=117 /DNA_ID=CAMNT_0053289309 /DNA_START=108 /DNA_END=458 /DNA_ORIENTATION=+